MRTGGLANDMRSLTSCTTTTPRKRCGKNVEAGSHMLAELPKTI